MEIMQQEMLFSRTMKIIITDLDLCYFQFFDYITDHQLSTDHIVCFGDSITHGDGSLDKESYPAYLLKLLTHPV